MCVCVFSIYLLTNIFIEYTFLNSVDSGSAETGRWAEWTQWTAVAGEANSMTRTRECLDEATTGLCFLL